MSYVALAVGIVGTGYKIYDSAHKASQAKKLAAANKRPIFRADGSIAQVYDLATSEVNDTRLQDYTGRKLDQSLSASIDAALKAGGKADFGVHANQYGSQFTAALETLDKNRDSKVAAFNNAAYGKAKSADAEFSYNKDGPYKDTKQQEAALRQQSAQSAADAVTTAAGTVANYGIATTHPGTYAERALEAEKKEAARIAGFSSGVEFYNPRPNFSAAGRTLDASTNLPPNVVPGRVNTNLGPSAVNTNFMYQQPPGPYGNFEFDEFGNYIPH